MMQLNKIKNQNWKLSDNGTGIILKGTPRIKEEVRVAWSRIRAGKRGGSERKSSSSNRVVVRSGRVVEFLSSKTVEW